MNPWISAIRLRTLPLSIAGIITGGAMAFKNSASAFNLLVFLLAISTALLLQILSNFANDYGDFENGADNDSRQGPARAVQSGAISAKSMKKAIAVSAIFSLISGITLLYYSFSTITIQFVGYFIIGILGIAAALKYTMGANPYGYKGLGDVFVFVFFGLVSSVGTFYLLNHTFSWIILLPSISIGAWSTAVLNLNNLRDIDNDKAVGKITIPVRLGKESGLIYHYILIFTPFISNMCYATLTGNNTLIIITLLAILPAYLLFKPLFHNPDHKTLDKALKHTALFSLLFTVLFLLGLWLN